MASASEARILNVSVHGLGCTQQKGLVFRYGPVLGAQGGFVLHPRFTVDTSGVVLCFDLALTFIIQGPSG